MITMYQELIPLSNKMLDKSISNSGYKNPIIIPFIFNATGVENIMETVLYIRNDSQEHYYKDIVISLMKDDGTTPVDSSASLIIGNEILFSLNAASGSNNIGVESAYLYSEEVTGSILENKYKSSYVPITDDSIVSVKFSYGYDELSYSDWAEKKSILVIPNIGTLGLGDTSYIPVRMRIVWKAVPSMFTVRDYFVDISYAQEIGI